MCDQNISEDFNDLVEYVSNESEKEKQSEEKKERPSSAKKFGRHSHFLKCENHHHEKEWSKGECTKCILFTKSNTLPPGKLPNKHEVLSFLLTKGEDNFGKGEKRSILHEAASCLALHWIYCNVYPISLKSIKKKLVHLKDEYRTLKKICHSKRGKAYFAKLDDFVLSCGKLFDIIGDSQQIRKHQNTWNVQMTDEDYAFHKNQGMQPRIGYCSSFVCRKSAIKDLERSKRKERAKASLKKADDYKKSMKPKRLFDENDDMSDTPTDVDQDYEPESKSKKRKYDYQKSFNDEDDDDMPFKYRHVRNGLRSVRPEIYQVASTLNSKYHLSRS